MKWTKFFAVLVVAAALGGCTTQTTVLDPDTPVHKSDKYNYTDLKQVTETMVSSSLGKAPLKQRDDRPIIIWFDIENRTSEHIDTKAIAEKMMTAMTQSGQVRFVDSDIRRQIEAEMGYQAGGMTNSAERIKVGKQAGAEFAFSGSIMSIAEPEGKQFPRFTKDKVRYYKFMIKLTDLNSGIIEWSEEKEFAREVSKPMIGW